MAKDADDTSSLETQVLAEAINQIALMLTKCENILCDVLPEGVIQSLMAGHQIVAERFETASIIFTDLVGFEDFGEKRDAGELIKIINGIFTIFDSIIL